MNHFFILVAIAFVPMFSCATKQNKFDLMDARSYIGEWQITNYQKISGGLTTENEIKNYSLSNIVVGEKYFVKGGKVTKIAKYKVRRIEPISIEGVVGLNSELSTWWGYRTDRKYVIKFEIIDIENDVYSFFEVLDNTTLTKYDGWLLFLRKLK